MQTCLLNPSLRKTKQPSLEKEVSPAAEKISPTFPVTSGCKLPGCFSWSFPDVRV